MRNAINNHFLSLLIAVSFSVFMKDNPCLSQQPFIFGTQSTWGKNGRPFSYNGAKFSIFDATCMDANLSGINMSLICSKVRGLSGFSFAPYSLADKMTGFQIAFLSKTTTLKGLQIGLLNQRTKFLKPNMKAGNYGLQIGLSNATFTNFGVQCGLYNSSWSGNKGISIGGININSLFQIGILNIKNSSNKGMQIGIINYRKNNKWFVKILPLMNLRIERKESF